MPTEQDLTNCSKCLKNTKLLSGDFASVVRRVREGDFVYLDPPYTSKDRPTYGEYGYGAFNEADLERLFKLLTTIDEARATFLLSYKHTTELSQVFSGWHVARVSAHKHVSGFAEHRSRVTELLVSNRPFLERVVSGRSK
jgi:DNA adenine methylase